MKWLIATVIPALLILACVTRAADRTTIAAAGGGGAAAVTYPSNYSVRVHLTYLNCIMGQWQTVPMEAVDNDHQTWDPDGWLDDADDEIDLPGPGVYEYVLNAYNNSLQQRHSSRVMYHPLYVVDGAITNVIGVDGYQNIMSSSAHGSRSASWRGVFEVTSDTPFVFVQTRGWFGGGRNFQEGFLFINRKSDTTP